MNKLSQLFKNPYLYVFIIVIGISLKFYKLDQQFFWDDEIATVLHTTGIPMSEYEKNIPVNQITSRKYFDDLLRVSDRDFKIVDQFIGLMKMPQLTPGHYYYFIFLSRIFGDGYMTFRYFSVFIFLISLAFLFLVTRKIFNSSIVAWIATSLYSVSPFFQVYAQESRYYILWALAIVAMHYLYLMAMEKQTLKWWGIYIVVGFLAVHTTLLFYISLMVHFIYTLIYYRHKWKAVIVSLVGIFLSSLPWLIYIYLNRHQIQSSLEWQKTGVSSAFSLFELLDIHLNRLTTVFIAFWELHLSRSAVIILKWVYRILVIGGIGVFFWKANNKQRWFVGLLAFLGVLIIISSDLIRSSGASRLPRYLLVNFIGFIMMYAFVLKKAMEKRTLLFGILFLLIITGSIMSSVAVTNDTGLYKRQDAYFHIQDAKEKFSGNEKILIISDFQMMGSNSYTTFMSLLHASSNKNIDFVYAKPDYPDFKQELDLTPYKTVYGMYMSEKLSAKLKNTYGDERFKKLEDRKMYNIFKYPVYTIEKN